jgi:CHAD domain-containing protein
MGLTPVAVRELSENLVRDFDVRVTRRSRMERLLSTPQVADPSHFVPRGNVAAGDTLLVAVRRVLSGQLRRLRKHDPGTRAGTDPEELHDMRVATRRMRAAVRTYSPALPRTLHETLAKDLRWLGRRLGSVRDLDVLTERFVELGVDPHFLEHLRRRRAAARERMLPALRSRRYLRLLSNLDALSRGWSVEPLPEAAFHPVGRHVAREARKARDRLVRQGQAAMERPASELLHETRIRAKRLRYLLEFHQQLGGSGARSLIRRLKAIQDHLGAHQDAVVAREEIQAFLGKHGDVLPPEAHASAERCLLRLGNEAASLRRRWKGRWLRLRAALSGPAAEAVMERLEKKNGDAPLGAP